MDFEEAFSLDPEEQDAEAAPEPAFDWTESELMDFLARAWQQESPSNVQVIGRYSRHPGQPFAFLRNLAHPVTGVALPAPVPQSKVHDWVYVSHQELQRLEGIQPHLEFVIATVDLSPKNRRQERSDPLACMVREGSAIPLKKIPSTWRVDALQVQGESVHRLSELAVQMVEDQIRSETEAASKTLEEARSKQEILDEKLKRIEDKIRSANASLEGALESVEDKVRLKEANLKKELKGLQSEIRKGARRLREIEAENVARRDELEKKMRELNALMREKGDRMVALRLVEETDLEKLFPSAENSRERPGHDFQSALDGDWGRLAAYVQACLWRKGLQYSRAQLQNFLALLRTNDLIILAGDSGSGKSSLVKSMAEVLGGKCTVVPVKPNWTSSDDLLGYYNPIEGRYQATPFLIALLEAMREPEVPHFICLDEMNLARVEYYFADLLSLLESRGTAPSIPLYTSSEERQTVVDNRLFLNLEEEARTRAGLSADASLEDMLMDDKANSELRKLTGFKESETMLVHHAKLRRSLAGLIEIPPAFPFPSNVWIVGAINVDETTHYLSPKVLDRAHVMRFTNPVLIDWEEIEKELMDFDLDLDLPILLQAADIGTRSEYPGFDRSDADVAWLVELARDFLDPLGVEFGLRAIRQSTNYMARADEVGIKRLEALNNIVLQKILPKLVIEIDKKAPTGKTRGELLSEMVAVLASKFSSLDEHAVPESALVALRKLIDRAEVNHGVANFWAR